MMRCPGFANQKYDPPRKTHIARGPDWDRRYSLDQFAQQFHVVPAPPPPEASSNGTEKINTGRHDWLKNRAAGYRHKGDAPEAIFKKLQVDRDERCGPGVPPRVIHDYELRELAKWFSGKATAEREPGEEGPHSPAPPPAARPKPKVWESTEFLSVEFPPQEPLVVLQGFETPVFTKSSTNQIFGWRGTGKSMVVTALAGVMSTGGSFLNYRVLRPLRVLLVDGELPNAQLQQRMKLLFGPDAKIALVTSDSTPGGIPSMATAEGQEWFEDAISQCQPDVFIPDSLATLAPFAANDEEKWLPLNSWMIRLRSRGLCILATHQAGKLGLQRAHSRNDDPLDVQIKLTAKEEESDHLDLELTYEKFRPKKTGVRALHVEYNQEWKWSVLEADKLKVLEEYTCLHPKASSRTIARDLPELGSHINVQKLLRKLTQAGK
jgi:putative DNA primase/helicase